MAYSHYKEHRSVENAETFLLTLLKEVKYEKDAVSSKSASKSTHRSPSDAIAFEPFHNPIQNNTFFGRQDMFEKIRSVLCSLGTCIIYGIGGLGKSYCSLKYAAEYEDSYTQIQQIIFTGDIKNTILKIKFTGLDESHFSEDEKFEKRLSILASYGEDTLLIIDNMDTHPADRENYVRLNYRYIFSSLQERPISIQKSFSCRSIRFPSKNSFNYLCTTDGLRSPKMNTATILKYSIW